MTEGQSKLWAAVVAGLVAFITTISTLFGTTFLGTEDARRENSLQFVNIAIDILRSKPDEKNGPLRQWAIEIINHHHPEVPIDEMTREVLLKNAWDVTPFYSSEWKKFDGVITNERALKPLEETSAAPPSGD